jgi:hypothetical protein
MQLSFSYEKKKVIQALRYHFIARNEIRVMVILVNVFAIFSAVLYYIGKIRAEPLLLGTFIWVMMLISVWYILPYTIYKKSSTFKDEFIVNFSSTGINVENEKGYANWEWNSFHKFFESPHFFHLYFNPKSFFLIPKENMEDDFRKDLRELLNKNVNNKK